MEIQVAYFYNKIPYNLANGIFDIPHVMDITNHLQKRYSPFSDEIREEKGYLKIDLSHTKVPKEIHFEAVPMGLSDRLNSSIAIYISKLESSTANI